MPRIKTLDDAVAAIVQLGRRLERAEGEIADLKQMVAVKPRRMVSARQLNAGAAQPQPSIEAQVLADEAARVRSGEAVHPPPAAPNQVVWGHAADIHRADDFIGWVFNFPTGTGHLLCSQDDDQPFGVRIEVQLKDGRRWATSFTELERRT